MDAMIKARMWFDLFTEKKKKERDCKFVIIKDKQLQCPLLHILHSSCSTLQLLASCVVSLFYLYMFSLLLLYMPKHCIYIYSFQWFPGTSSRPAPHLCCTIWSGVNKVYIYIFTNVNRLSSMSEWKHVGKQVPANV